MSDPKVSIIIPAYNVEKYITKTLDSIPRRNDIEVIICDDGSTDDTVEIVQWYMVGDHSPLQWYIWFNGENKGLAYTKNKLIRLARGKYFHELDGDDWLNTELYEKVLDIADDQDIICMNLEVNDGSIWELTPELVRTWCGQPCRLIKREFASGIRCNEKLRYGEDLSFNEELMARNPNIVYTGLAAYHYNWPREGSLCWLSSKNLIEQEIK